MPRAVSLVSPDNTKTFPASNCLPLSRATRSSGYLPVPRNSVQGRSITGHSGRRIASQRRQADRGHSSGTV
jgi:hypothetical protein